MSEEKLTYQLAAQLAVVEIETMEQMYHEDAEHYASEGITLTSYMSNQYAHEGMEEWIDETVCDQLKEQAVLKFKELISQKYKKQH